MKSHTKIFKNLSYGKINRVDLLYLIIDKINEYTEKRNGKMTLFPTDKSKGRLKKYKELWNKIRDFIRSINNNSGNYDKKKSNLIRMMIYL